MVDFIDRNEKSQQRDKQNTAVKLQKNTANKVQSHIEAKFKVTQEEKRVTVSVIYRQNQMTYAKNYIRFNTIKNRQY